MTDEREAVERKPWFQDMKALMLNSAGLWKEEIGSLEKQRWIDMANNAEHALFAAYRAGQASMRVKAPLSIDCDGCGQVVEIPTEGSVTCGCNGVLWRLSKARAAEGRRKA